MQYNEKQYQILDASERLFARNGFDGTSVRDIAKEADVNVAMISYYFGSKEKLLETIFMRRSEFIRLQLENMLNNDTMKPIDKVYKLIEAYVDKAITQQNFHRLMLCVQVTEQAESVLTKAIYDVKRENHELIKKLIHEGQKKGDFKKNIDISLMMATLVGTANHTISTKRFYCEINGLKNEPDEVVDKLIRKKLIVHLKTLFKSILTYEA